MRTSAPSLPHPTRTSPGRVAALCLALGGAACTSVPTLLPPPFGPDVDHPQPIRLFFPTALAFAPSGHLLVVNGNFDHAFDSGTMVALSPSYLAGVLARSDPTSTDPALVPPEAIPASAFTGAVLVGNYGGSLVFDATSSRAYTASRDDSRLQAADLDPASGRLRCAGGSSSSTDCRDGLVDLAASFGVSGPIDLVPGFARLPGTAVDQAVLFVPAMTPIIDQTINNLYYTHGPVAALLQRDPTKALFVANASTASLAGGIGAGTSVFDAARRQLVLSGCYLRTSNGSVGEPATVKCGTTRTTNLVRFLGVDGGAASSITAIDLAPDVRSVDTSDVVLGDFDAQGVSHTVFAAVRNPDLIVEVDRPADPTQPARFRRAVPVPISPGKLLRLARPPDRPGPDLVLISAETSGTVAIYDTGVDRVVGQVEHLGSQPWALAQVPPKAGDTRLVVAATVFGDCRVAILDIDLDHPWIARLRARLGSCP